MLVTCSSDICEIVTSQSYVVLYMCVKRPPTSLCPKTSSRRRLLAMGHPFTRSKTYTVRVVEYSDGSAD